MEELKDGDLVQVRKTIAGGQEPIVDWVSGYIFVSEKDGVVKVMETCGPFTGCVYNYDRTSVRKDI